MPTSPLLVTQHVTGAGHVLALRGELDEETGRAARDAADVLLRTGVREVTVDLRGLEHLDSGGLHALASLDEAVRRSGGRASFVPPPSRLHRLFAAVGLHDLAFVEPG